MKRLLLLGIPLDPTLVFSVKSFLNSFLSTQRSGDWFTDPGG